MPALAPLMAGGELPLTAHLTFVVGENGSGKSTLVEAIAEQFGLDARGGRAAKLGGNLDTPKTPLGEALHLDLTMRGLAMRRGPRTARRDLPGRTGDRARGAPAGGAAHRRPGCGGGVHRTPAGTDLPRGLSYC
ncbi:hypothetical protein TTY48_37720 [Tsukamurella sp. TY48]|uniref:ATP-binding protein n=1 Tax=Tsukamurella TaxID=2060 RepID=UPI001C7E14A2|nr:ATP-binding protein [Tsukamurella sp. TY48]GIZ99160.1 hypothetical protein TTY48_37720 [Tsukamurella sp. TY48]